MTANNRGIPEIRDRLRELADETGIDELSSLADEMYRKQPEKRARTRSPKLTPEMAENIRQYALAHPDAHQQDIAEYFGVNHGRISQAINYEVSRIVFALTILDPRNTPWCVASLAL